MVSSMASISLSSLPSLLGVAGDQLLAMETPAAVSPLRGGGTREAVGTEGHHDLHWTHALHVQCVPQQKQQLLFLTDCRHYTSCVQRTPVQKNCFVICKSLWGCFPSLSAFIDIVYRLHAKQLSLSGCFVICGVCGGISPVFHHSVIYFTIFMYNNSLCVRLSLVKGNSAKKMPEVLSTLSTSIMHITQKQQPKELSQDNCPVKHTL